MDPYRFSWDADALVVIPGLAAAYLIALTRFPAPRWRIACFMAGCALMLAVQIGPADTLALHYLLTMHFLQNVAIAEWGPLLIVLGLTPAMAHEPLRIPGARALTHPLVALPIWLATYFTWHTPWAYDAALRRQWTEALYDDLGETALAQGNCGTVRGHIELLDGDPAAAERALRASYEGLAAMGDRAYLATRAAELAEAVYRNGRLEEAAGLTETAQATGGADDVPTQFLWRTVRAKVFARQGRAAEAEELARMAVALVETTDAPNFRGAVVLDLAEVLDRSGRADEAASAAARALDLFEQKGNVVEAGRARALAVA